MTRSAILGLLGVIMVWPTPGGDLMFIDFEQTGCLNEGTPVTLESAESNADCDNTASPLNGTQSGKFAGSSASVRTPALSHDSRSCWEFHVKHISGGNDDTKPIFATDASGAAVYPEVAYRTGAVLDLLCSASSRSATTSVALSTTAYRTLTVDFTETDSSGCLSLFDPVDYQNGSSVCCNAGTSQVWSKIKFGNSGFGLAPDTYMDDVRIYNGPCELAPLFEDLNADNNHGSNSTSFVFTAPGNREVGDLLLAFVGQESSVDCVFTAPTGWTQIGSTSNGSGLRGTTAVYWNTLDDATEAGTSTYTWTSTCSREWVGAMHKIAARTYDDASPGSWLISLSDYVETIAGASAFPCQSVSNLPERAMVARAAFWETSSTDSVTADWSVGTESFDVFTSGGGNANIMVHGVEQQEASGTVGSNTTDPTGTIDRDVHCWTIPIKPAA